MKNQIIKKIMAYLLVGAMVITTPMTASANELENAYSTGTEDGKNTGTGSGSGTSTSTNTETAAVKIPENVIEKVPQILGISLEPAVFAFDAPNQTKPVQARVVFDEYNPDGEDMQWKEREKIDAGEKEEIESQIHWFSDDYSVASFASNQVDDTKMGSKAIVKSVGGGETKIYAWIEADGKQYVNAPNRPTEGDIIAEATVTVKNTVSKIIFNEATADLNFKKFDKFASGKRQYDLRKYTILEYSDGTKQLASESNVDLTYSISNATDLKTNKVTAAVTEAGLLKVTKGDAKKIIELDIVSGDGTYGTGTIELVKPNPVKAIAKFDDAYKTKTLDMGIASEAIDDTIECPAVTNQNDPQGIDGTTDELVWSSNKPAIVEVTSRDEGAKATITAKGVGKAKITVKASSGKSQSFNVTVYATPDDIEIVGAETGYSGKPITLNAVLLGDEGQTLPVGTTTFKWTIDQTNKKDSKISAKKDVATVTPANLLSNIASGVTATINVTATYKNPTKGTVSPDEAHEIHLTQSDVKNVSIEIFQKVQSEGAEHKYDLIDTMNVTNGKNNKETWAVTYNNKTEKKFYVGQKYFMDAKGDGQLDSIAWAVSGKNVNYDVNDAQLITNFTGSAKTTIKASYITLNEQKTKATKNTKTINITPIQNATSIAFAKPVVVKNPAKNTAKPQTVTFTIKDVVPKKANYGTVQWKVMAYDSAANKTYVQNTTLKDAVKKDDLIKLTNKPNYKSVTINVPGDFKAGSVIKVGAYSQAGVVAYGYIYITEQTTKVIPQASTDGGLTYKEAGTKKNVNVQTIALGSKDTLKLSAKLATKYFENGATVTESDRDVAMGEMKLGDPTYGTTTAYQTEPITYSLDKKSALIIKVDADGNVTPLKKGTATVTIKTLSNKSAKVTVVVE